MTDQKCVETWQAVAAVVGRSERWCRSMASRKVRPLPVAKFGGIVRAYIGELNDWLRAERLLPAGAAYLDSARTIPTFTYGRGRSISVKPKTRGAIVEAAYGKGLTIRKHCDAVINALLDKAGAP